MKATIVAIAKGQRFLQKTERLTRGKNVQIFLENERAPREARISEYYGLRDLEK